VPIPQPRNPTLSSTPRPFHRRHPSQLNGSLARAAIRELLAKQLIKPVAEHSNQKIYTRAVGA
jgi:ribosomal protein S25